MPSKVKVPKASTSLNLVDIGRQMESAGPQDVLVIPDASDPLLRADVEAWCRRHGHSVEYERSATSLRLLIHPNKELEASYA